LNKDIQNIVYKRRMRYVEVNKLMIFTYEIVYISEIIEF